MTHSSPIVWSDELPEWVKPGAVFWFNFPEPGAFGGTNRHHRRKFEVRGIVDDQAVIREWWKRKQRWNYTVEGPAHFSAFSQRIVLRRPPPAKTEKT